MDRVTVTQEEFEELWRQVDLDDRQEILARHNLIIGIKEYLNTYSISRHRAAAMVGLSGVENELFIAGQYEQLKTDTLRSIGNTLITRWG